MLIVHTFASTRLLRSCRCLQGFYYDAFYHGLTLTEKDDFGKIQATANKAVKVRFLSASLMDCDSNP